MHDIWKNRAQKPQDGQDWCALAFNHTIATSLACFGAALLFVAEKLHWTNLVSNGFETKHQWIA